MLSFMCLWQTVDPKEVEHVTWTAQRTPASAMNLRDTQWGPRLSSGYTQTYIK